MVAPVSLDDRIARLNREISKSLRTELECGLRTLRAAQDPISVLLRMSRASLLLLDEVLAVVKEKRPNDNLHACILRAGDGSPKDPKVDGLRLLPMERATNLHTIRVWSNKVDHAAEQSHLGVSDAENALNLFLSVVEWFYCKWANGPQLVSLYSTPEKTPDELQTSLEIVKLALEDLLLESSVTLTGICQVLEVAVSLGAPIYNQGSHLGCARIYSLAAKGIGIIIDRAEKNAIAVDAAVKAAGQELHGALNAFRTLGLENANEAAWALRHAFDRTINMAVVEQGMMEVDVLLENASTVEKPLTAALIGAAIRIALAHGNILFREGLLQHCAALHLHTAKSILASLDRSPTASAPSGKAIATSRTLLRPIVQAFPEATSEQAEELAWALYLAFQEILEATE